MRPTGSEDPSMPLAMGDVEQTMEVGGENNACSPEEDAARDSFSPEPSAPSLPVMDIPFFQQQHSNDRVTKAALSAVIIADGETFGSLDASSAFRWIPSLITMYPTFIISVRENHLVGDELKRRQQDMQNRGITGFDSSGREVNAFRDDYAETTYEFDLSLLDDLNVGLCETEDSSHLVGHHNTRALIEGNIGTIKFRTTATPLKLKRQAREFSTGSRQSHFASTASLRRNFTIFVDISQATGRVFRAFKDVCVPCRSYGTGDIPRNDWFFSRHASYGTNPFRPFAEYVANDNLRLPVPPWLEKSTGETGTVYPLSDAVNVSRARYPTASAYVQHFAAALLYERDEIMKQQRALYNTDTVFPASSVMITPTEFDISIQVCGLSVRCGTVNTINSHSKTIPSAGTHIVLIQPGNSDQGGDIEGIVSSFTRPGFDFTVEATLPEKFQRRKIPVKAEELSEFHVLLKYCGVAMQRKLTAVHRAGRLIDNESKPRAGLRRFSSDRSPEGGFCLRNIIIDVPESYQSPGLFTSWSHSDTPPRQQPEDIAESIGDLLGNLTHQQATFAKKALYGTHISTLLLEGFPGSGKTSTLATLVVCALRMGYKLMMTSQSNQGVDSLLESVVALLRKSGFDYLVDACVRLRCSSAERGLGEELSAKSYQGSRRAALASLSMAARMAQFAADNPTNPTARIYLDHLAARRRKQSNLLLPGWNQTLIGMRNLVLGSCQLVACTAFVASDLEDTIFTPQIIIFDEAGQATDPDLMMTITPYVGNIALLVLAGDPKQLGPVVHSSSNNVYSNILSTSAMLRIKQDHDISCVELTENFRGHRSTWQMANKLFYDGKMTSGGDPSLWDQTYLSRSMLHFLRGASMSNAYRHRHLALAPKNRQFFFDVQSRPVREEGTYSWWNPGGVNAIVSFAKFMIFTGVADAEDIGIISMFAQDVCRIQAQLEANGVPVAHGTRLGVKTATVAQFQGAQRKIILLHFVAAFDDPVDPFGSVKNPRLLNVAITRAHEFQFMFGNYSFWRQQQANQLAAGKNRTVGGFSKMIGLSDYVRDNGQLVDWSRVGREVRECSVEVSVEGAEQMRAWQEMAEPHMMDTDLLSL